jgi:hypothetical protein
MTQDYAAVIAKYKALLKKNSGLTKIDNYVPPPSVDYEEFKKKYLPKSFSFYEKLCYYSAKIIQIDPKGKDLEKLKENIRIAHLNITPTQAYTAQFIIPTIVGLLGLFVSILLLNSLFFAFFSLVLGFTLVLMLAKVPEFLSQRWRLQASNQMVLCVFYIVTYMKHTSNIENALKFAAQYLSGPLATDLSRVLEDALTFGSVNKSLDNYLVTWRKYNPEFVHAFGLITRSLLESTEEKRKQTLTRGLTEMLEETQEKMLHYAQDLKSKIMTLHMLGIVLPILGLVILPLVVSFMEGVAWYHIATLYNIILPILVYLWGTNALNQRPTGYGDTDLSETKVDLNHPVTLFGKLKVKTKNVKYFAGAVGGLFFLIALLPLIIHWVSPTWDISFPLGFSFLGYRESSSTQGLIVGPFGIGASILSLFFPIALAFGMGLYYKWSIEKKYSVRKKAHDIEREFSTALYQLGNVLAQDRPLEYAIPEAAKAMNVSTSGEFFRLVTANMRFRSMNAEEAIFDPQRGAMVKFPSNIINSSMRILVESVQKSPLVAAEALWGISQYIKDIHRVNERLKDLLAEIISDMKSQINLLTPAIAGIVIGITSMITFILSRLAVNFKSVSAVDSGSTLSNITNLFGDGLPTYYFQLVVGIYVVQIVYILTIMSNGIENGADDVGEKHFLGVNLLRSPVIYCTISLIVMLIFNLIAGVILGKTIS